MFFYDFISLSNRKMIYTFQKRKELNEAFVAELKKRLGEELIPGTKTGKGIPILYLSKIPDGAERVFSIADLVYKIPHQVKPWDEVVPVIHRVKENGTETTYEVGYVNCSPGSINMATERIANGAMWIMPGMTLKTDKNIR